MPFYNVTIQICDSFKKPFTILVQDDNNSLVAGEVFYFTYICNSAICPGGDSFCATVISFTQTFFASPDYYNISNSYGVNGCSQCQSDNLGNLVFNPCSRFGESIIIDAVNFSPLPIVGEVYFISAYIGAFGQSAQFSGCYTFRGYSSESSEYQIVLTSKDLKLDCQDCLSTSSLIYEVRECVSNDTYYIPLPTNLVGHLITFTDLSEITQFCGYVIELPFFPPSVANGILVSDLGVYNDLTNNCTTCLSNVAEKKKIVDCLDPLNFEIVWASTLFNVGTATHLSTPGGGCFTISPDIIPSGETITLNEFVDFQPQEECEDCLECYGLIYEYQTCEEIETFEPFNVIDTSSNSLYCNRGIVVDSFDIAYFVSSCPAIIGKLDLSTQTILQSQPIGYTPTYLAIDEVNGVICVANQGNSVITFINLADLSQSTTLSPGMTNNNPTSVYFDPIDSLFYVTYSNCCSSPTIEVFSGTAYNLMSFVTSFGSTDGYNSIVRVGSNLYMLRATNTLEVYGIVSPGSYVSLTSYFLPIFPTAMDYDGINSLYLSYYGSCLIWNISSPSYSLINFPYNCGGGSQSIKVNNITDRIYITTYNCNTIHEIQKSTNTFLREYTLSNYPYSNFFQPFGIANDTIGNTWFTSYDDVFQLGSNLGIVTGSTTSSEYLSAGTVFFNYALSACCEITSVNPIESDTDVLNRDYLSMVSYESCEICTGTTHTTWVCRLCDFPGGDFDLTLVDPLGIYGIGDVVKVHYGNSNFLCAEIIDTYNLSYGVNLPSFDAQGEPSFSSCTECSSGGTVGLTIINCDTLVPQTINVTIAEYIQIFGFPFNVPQKVISDVNGTCYQIVNLCPIETPAPLFEISNLYINQTFCRLGNSGGKPGPVSAGTEYFACQICCPCESGSTVTSVAVPHPVWTGLYGNSVTLLDAVQLGGMNGLNN